MTSPTVEIVTLRRADGRASADVLCESHDDYPAFRHLFPDRRRRQRALSAFFAATARDAAPFGVSLGARAGDGRLLAVALWLPPGKFRWSAARRLRAAPAFARVAFAAPRSLRAFMATGANSERSHPLDPHWYLVVLGVRPEAQHRGLGSRLLEPAFARADRERVPCYLETARRENLPFYERLGFVVTEEGLALVPGGPTHWGMWRPAAT